MSKELEKVTLNLFKGDKEILASFYPKVGGWSVAMRRIIRKHCVALKKREAELHAQSPGRDEFSITE